VRSSTNTDGGVLKCTDVNIRDGGDDLVAQSLVNFVVVWFEYFLFLFEVLAVYFSDLIACCTN
jgi:hypothetical protein